MIVIVKTPDCSRSKEDVRFTNDGLHVYGTSTAAIHTRLYLDSSAERNAAQSSVLSALAVDTVGYVPDGEAIGRHRQ